jgi:Uma2 family endonuclease
LDSKSRLEPDILVSTAAYDPDRTWYAPEDVALVVEVVSQESADRDRSLKSFKYSQATIAHFWRIEDEAGAPTVHTYELDAVTSTYVPTGIHRGRLKVSVPFPLDIDLDDLLP